MESITELNSNVWSETMDEPTTDSVDLPSNRMNGQSRIDNHSMAMVEAHSRWNDKRPDANEATDASTRLTEYTGVQLLPLGVKILKRGNDKGEPGGSVAKLIGKINSKNLLKQKAKKAKDTFPSPKSSMNPIRDKNKYERVGKQKKNVNIDARQSVDPATSTSPFKLPKPHYIPPQQQSTTTRQKETSQCEISYQLQTNHPLTMERLAAPPAIKATINTPSHSTFASDNSQNNQFPKSTFTPTTTTTTHWWKEITILIHLIDGFEIEEADAPFPIGKEELDEDNVLDRPVDRAIDETPTDDQPENASETRQNDGVPSTASVTNDENRFLEPPPAKFAKHSPTKIIQSPTSTTITTSPEVKRETESSPSKCLNVVVDGQTPLERNSSAPLRNSTSEDDDDEDSISIGSKENAASTREEMMMNVDYASSPPSHSPVSFPLRDVSSTDSFPSHHLDAEELVDEKPAIFLCEPDGDKRIEEWTEQDVYHFISGIEGCSQYAEEFISQEIDGQALVLLNEDHLMTNLNVKLGPALKILAKIQENKK